MNAQSPNEISISAAGSGKTTRIVKAALGQGVGRSALVTYTNNNASEIRKKLYEQSGSIPERVEVWTWYSFLLREFVRPYQRELLSERVETYEWVAGKSAIYAPRSDIARYFFLSKGRLYSDKASELAILLNKMSAGAVIARLEERFDCIYIDEAQDLAGYDLELVELLLKSRIKVVLVGDPRQAIYATNYSPKNSAFRKSKVGERFHQWRRAGLAVLSIDGTTHRCNQQIASFADALFPSDPPTTSANSRITGHDGVFLVPLLKVGEYIRDFSPQVLRLSVKTQCAGFDACNFGESKGLTFDRVLIFPHKEATKWLATGDFAHIEKSASKMYVGLTRARFSVAFAFDGKSPLNGVNTCMAW